MILRKGWTAAAIAALCMSYGCSDLLKDEKKSSDDVETSKADGGASDGTGDSGDGGTGDGGGEDLVSGDGSSDGGVGDCPTDHDFKNPKALECIETKSVVELLALLPEGVQVDANSIEKTVSFDCPEGWISILAVTGNGQDGGSEDGSSVGEAVEL